MAWRLALACVLVAVAAQDAFAASELVYRIDSASVAATRGRLVVSANGAVKSGGWTKPMLRIRRGTAPADTLMVEFVATPPRSMRAVVQVILPISASLTTALRPRTLQVKLISRSNSVTVPIVAKPHAAATAVPPRSTRVARTL